MPPEDPIPPPSVPIPIAISQILQTYTPQQLIQIVSQLKAVSTTNPEQGIYVRERELMDSSTTFEQSTSTGLRSFSGSIDDESGRCICDSARHRFDCSIRRSRSSASCICTTSAGPSDRRSSEGMCLLFQVFLTGRLLSFNKL
jgi:Hinge domain of cleavage stimulation factor subunit 2